MHTETIAGRLQTLLNMLHKDTAPYKECKELLQWAMQGFIPNADAPTAIYKNWLMVMQRANKIYEGVKK